MSLKKKCLLATLIACVVVLLIVLLPLVNYVVGLPQSPALAAIATDDARFSNALEIMGAKCANCHTEDYILPFYASFPIAKPIIEKDIQMGIEFMDMPDVLTMADGQPVGEVTLAKIEYTIDQDTMPPFRYLALHWDGGMSQTERDALKEWITETRAAHYATPGVPDHVKRLVVQPLPDSHDEDPVRVALGDQLFHDTRLSRDNTISCASCHDLAKGGTDQAPVSTGVDGQLGPINSPTVFNAVFNIAQFWDGRSGDLQAQASGPVTDPLEMDTNFDVVVERLNGDAEFVEAFTQAYPEGISEETITHAIATFEKTLITPNCPFDQYLLGNEDAIDEAAKRGWELFQVNGCAMCHVGKAMGGQSFEKVGRFADYFAERGGEISPRADFGLFNVTQNEKDKFRQKTPVLRNIALTFPYFHDASAETMEDAILSMAQFQMGFNLSESEIADIVAFFHTLTGEYLGQPLDQM